MPDWSKIIAAIGYSIEREVDDLTARMRRRSGEKRGVQVLPFRGYGNDHQVYFKGRVLRAATHRPPLEGDRLWRNLLFTYRRFDSREVSHAKLQVRFGAQTREIETDDEGYFELFLKNDPSLAGEWREAHFTLLTGHPDSAAHPSATGLALFPSSTARFGVISDIDDTVMVTHARHFLKLAYTIFTKNAHGRVPFEGVPAFYRALRAGPSRADANPIFYVSSGPWNLYDLLTDFFAVKEIPIGPILLQDFGFDQTKFLTARHLDHKQAQINSILEMYPGLPFILIGDSGQHDPEVYSHVLEQHRGRILAIYIRNVTHHDRAAEIARLTEAAREHQVDFLLVKDSLEAARHAAAQGWITEAALPGISGETIQDKTAPEPSVEELSP